MANFNIPLGAFIFFAFSGAMMWLTFAIIGFYHVFGILEAWLNRVHPPKPVIYRETASYLWWRRA